MIRTYNELVRLPTYEERLEYLRLAGIVGQTTFGFNRYLNQKFYRSKEWKDVSRDVIIRDNGCDLGIEDRPIVDRIYIHHMNPITEQDIIERSSYLLDPRYLICVSFETHNAIHYGTIQKALPLERKPGDTCPWK